MKQIVEMKRWMEISRKAIILFAIMLAVGCSSDSDLLGDYTGDGSANGGTSGNGSSGNSTTYDSSLSDLVGFDISIDKTTLEESETIPTDGDVAEDYIENNTFNNEINIAFKVPRDYTQQGYTLLVSSPKMTKGNSYIFSSGATVSGGSDFCGYVTDATMSGGSSLATLALTSMVTTYNYSGGMNGGGGQPAGGGQPGGGPGWH